MLPGARLDWNFFEPTRQPDINAANELLEKQKYLFAVSARNLILDIQQSYYRAQRSQQLIESFEAIYEINKLELETLRTGLAITHRQVLMWHRGKLSFSHNWSN